MSAYVWLLTGALTLQTPAPGGAPPQAPPPQSPPSQAPPSQSDPATATFTTDAGLLLVAVKADKVADYEAVMTALREAFAASEDPARRAVAQGWRVYKAAEADAKGNTLFVHAVMPAVAGTDYRPSLWLDQLLQGAPAELLAKYKEALAGSPTRLSLVEVANMGVATKK